MQQRLIRRGRRRLTPSGRGTVQTQWQLREVRRKRCHCEVNCKRELPEEEANHKTDSVMGMGWERENELPDVREKGRETM